MGRFFKILNALSEGKAGESAYIDNIDRSVSLAIARVMEQFNNGIDVKYI